MPRRCSVFGVRVEAAQKLGSAELFMLSRIPSICAFIIVLFVFVYFVVLVLAISCLYSALVLIKLLLLSSKVPEVKTNQK